ncbi:MAG: beta-propeller domain-containing protein, partial [Acholeplasmataceae bacterium]|nr:beta-propeller domain-containing protein [Acholeplasmataceae bacterium]
MTFIGWLIVSILSVLGIFFAIQLVRDIVWNKKLGTYHKSSGIHLPKIPKIYWLKRSYGYILTSMFVATTVFSGAFDVPVMIGDKVLLNATPVGSAETIRSLIQNQQSGSFWDFFVGGDRGMLDSMVPEANQAPGEKAARDFIGTNVQVEGVDEADIVKTDGNTIYYAARYQNIVRVLTVNDNHTVTQEANLDLGKLYTDSLYLTETQLIVIGYIYDYRPYEYIDGSGMYDYMYTSFTGAVRIYNKETLELEYTLETDSNFYEHRLIGDEERGYALFLISNKSLYSDELRPMFKETVDGEITTNYLDYSSIYYFSGVPVYGMTVLTGIDLETYEVSSQAFLGYVSEIYASPTSLYTVQNYSTYTLGQYKNKVQIIKYNLDIENAKVSYAGQKQLSGYISDQYWMDEFEGHFRVVTSSWSPIHNELHILKENDKTDELDLVGSITQGLGLVNETVKSVRFSGNRGFVVTFEQTDPLYTIDLSNPKNPTIISIEKEPGYSTYLHVWNDEKTHLIGFGFDADSEGRVTGLRLSAFVISGTTELKGESDAVDSYILNSMDEDGIYSYSYSEASYNPKAMIVSPSHGIIAFPVMSWKYEQVGTWEWNYSYV